MKEKRFLSHEFFLSTTTWRAVLPLAVAASLVACGGGNGGSGFPAGFVPGTGGPPAPAEPPAMAKAQKTILIYMNGSDLESGRREGEQLHQGGMASANIQEMLQVHVGPDVNVIIETGGTDKDGWRTLKRQQIKNQKVVDLPPVPNENASMADPSTLTEFIAWGAKHFPAQDYVLFFWNHGGGPVGGFGGEQINLYQGMPSMSVKDIKLALEAGMQHTGKKFELIGFDACLMASFEIASALSGVGNYLAASAELEPGAGWDYEEILSYLARRPDVSGEDLGKKIANSFVEKNKDQANDLTFSVTNLNKVGALQKALDVVFSQFSVDLEQKGLPVWLALAAARAKTLDFTTDIFKGQTSVDVMDLGDFLRREELDELNMAPALQDAQDALDEAVVFKRWGAGLAETSGLTLFFPSMTLRHSEKQKIYRSNSTASPALVNFNTRYVDFVLGGQLSNPVVSVPTVQGDGSVLSTVSSHHFENAYAVLQAPDGTILSTQNAQRRDQSVGLAQPSNWPQLDGIPVLLSAPFNPQGTPSEYIVPALRLQDCQPKQGTWPVNKADEFIGFLVLQPTSPSSGDWVVKSYYGKHPFDSQNPTMSLHMSAPRLEPVTLEECFQVPQLKFDAAQNLMFEFVPERTVQFASQAERVLSFGSLPLTGHSIHMSVNDYSGQLLFASEPVRY